MNKNVNTPERRAQLTGYKKTYRAKHPERVKASRKRVYEGRKIRAMNLVGGPFCKRCGCDELSFLEFNHIAGGGCKDWRESGRQWPGDRLLSGMRSPEGLEVLCRLCNALDFLERKNPEMAKRFIVSWEALTGLKANKV